MFSKVRPVGSPVPRPESVKSFPMPWEKHYKAVFTGSGTEALSLSVRCAICKKSNVSAPEVIIPAYGCPDLVAAIVAQNAVPVLVDFAESVPFMEEPGVIEAITSQTVAVVAVNFLGIFERLPLLSQICRSKRITLIEDSAQCFPPFSSEDGCADFVVLSFGRGKPINLMGGGALLVRNTDQPVLEFLVSEYPVFSVTLDIAWYIKRLIVNFILSRYVYPIIASASFLNIGQTRFYPLKSISRLDIPRSLLEAGVMSYMEREPLHSIYDRELAFVVQSGWTRLTADHGFGKVSHLRYALLAPSNELRDRSIEELNKRGIVANAFYEKILPEIEGVEASYLKMPTDYPKANKFAARLIVLPTHSGVKRKDIATIVSAFRFLATVPA